VWAPARHRRNQSAFQTFPKRELGGWGLPPITGYLGRTMQVLPHSMLMSILGWTYFGYPIWAFWLGGRLRAEIRA
jgi:hypothetical protein